MFVAVGVRDKENQVQRKNHYKKGLCEWISFSEKNLCKSTLQKVLFTVKIYKFKR